MLTRYQFYTAVKPLDAEAFFKSYLAVFVVILFYIIAFVWKRGKWVKISEIDIDSGRREIDYEAFAKERSRKAAWPRWRKILDAFF